MFDGFPKLFTPKHQSGHPGAQGVEIINFTGICFINNLAYSSLVHCYIRVPRDLKPLAKLASGLHSGALGLGSITNLLGTNIFVKPASRVPRD